jgi:hypothetical protein
LHAFQQKLICDPIYPTPYAGELVNGLYRANIGKRDAIPEGWENSTTLSEVIRNLTLKKLLIAAR